MTLASSLYLSLFAGSLQHARCFCVFLIIFLMEVDVICSYCAFAYLYLDAHFKHTNYTELYVCIHSIDLFLVSLTM